MDWPLKRIDIAIYSGCNLRCKHCYQADLKNSEICLSYEKIKDVLLNCKDLGAYELTITGGEPLLHPNFFRILNLANKLGYKKIVFTNGTLIDENTANNFENYNVEAVQISLDGPRDIHDWIRGEGTFEKVLQGITLLVNRDINVIVNTQLTGNLLNHIAEWIKFLESLGISEVRFTITALLGDAKKNRVMTPMSYIERLRELLTIDIEQRKFCKNLSKCGALINNLAINYDGNVYPCEFFRSLAHYSLGNIYHETLEQIYLSWIQSESSLLRYFIEGVKECEECEFKSVCHRCPARIYSTYKSFEHPDPLYCILFGKRELPKGFDLSKLAYGSRVQYLK